MRGRSDAYDRREIARARAEARLSGDRGLVFPLASAADGAGRARRPATTSMSSPMSAAMGTRSPTWGFRFIACVAPRQHESVPARRAIARTIRARYRRIAPDLVHHVALEPTVVGSLAALGLPHRPPQRRDRLGFRPHLGEIAGARCPRRDRMAVAAPARRGRSSFALVQNADDRAALAGLGVPDDRIFLIAGSGVDVDLLRPLPEPDGPITIGFRRPPAREQGAAHSACCPRAARAARPCGAAVDRRRSGSGQSGFDSRRGDRRMESAPRHRVARPCRRYSPSMGGRAYCGAAVAARRIAEEPARSGGLRASARGDRRSGLPRHCAR